MRGETDTSREASGGGRLRVGICTLGCRVNQYESEVLAGLFAREGCETADFSEKCDIYIVNTCTVTAESDRKSRQMIRRAVNANPDAVVAVCGCFSQTNPAGAAIEGVDLVTGSANKTALVERTLALARKRAAGAVKPPPATDVGDLSGAAFETMSLTVAPRTRAFVKIEDGCRCRCSYCIIPAARGPVRSKPPRDVLDEVRTLVANGSREAVLTGIETSSYGEDFGGGYGLPELLREVSAIDGLERVRLGSLSPLTLNGAFIDAAASSEKIMPHFHLSIQSGSDAVLAAMRRRYNIGTVTANIAAARKAMPTVTFAADIIVGFPGETDADFEKTAEFCRKIRFTHLHVFTYSKRAGTPAAAMDGQVDERVKNERAAALEAVGAETFASLADEKINSGAVSEVLFETLRGGIARGHDAEFFEVEALCERLPDAITRVKPLSHSGGVLRGEII